MAPGQPRITLRPLPYETALEARRARVVDLLVIHCTELPDLDTARSYGESVLYRASGTGNSGHYYIDRDGRIEQWVEPLRTAHHVRGFNERSIGIELVNLGRYPDWLHSKNQEMQDPYPAEQIDSLLGLVRHLCFSLPALQWLAGHEELDRERVPASDRPSQTVYRKRDPGPLFPWPRLEGECPLKRLKQPGETASQPNGGPPG